MGDTVVVELQDGTPFSFELVPGGGARVVLPKVAVEIALLKARTSYPVLVGHLYPSSADIAATARLLSDGPLPPDMVQLDAAELLARPPHLSQAQADLLDNLVVQEKTES